MEQKCDLTVQRLRGGVPMKTVAGASSIFGGGESGDGGAPIKEVRIKTFNFHSTVIYYDSIELDCFFCDKVGNVSKNSRTFHFFLLFLFRLVVWALFFVLSLAMRH